MVDDAVPRPPDGSEVGLDGRHLETRVLPKGSRARWDIRRQPAQMGDRDIAARPQQSAPLLKARRKAKDVDRSLAPDQVEAVVGERDRGHRCLDDDDAIIDARRGGAATKLVKKRPVCIERDDTAITNPG